MADPMHSRRAYVRRRETKKKKRTHVALIILAGVLLLGFVLYLILQDHIEYTASGIRFILSEKAPSEPQTGTTVALPDEPVPARKAGFFPHVSGEVSVRSNGRPPYGAGYIDAQYVELETFTAEEAEDYAAALSEKGVHSVVIDIKNGIGRVNFTQNTIFAASAAALDERLETFLSACARWDIRVTGRICCFRDNELPRRDLSCAALASDGSLYEDEQGYSWLDPTSETVRSGLVELCALSAKLGVRELLLDDFGFPEGAGLRLSEEVDRVEALGALLSSIREAAGGQVVLSVTVYPDVLGEGASETRGQSLSELAQQCGHLWIRTEEEDEIRGYYYRLRQQSQKYADILCIIKGESYKSAMYYLEM